jgi:methionine synthase II (cobalamin-independent)
MATAQAEKITTARRFEAKQNYSEGKITKKDLKHTVADCIREIIVLQECIGIAL